jgi:hypothetical protein
LSSNGRGDPGPKETGPPKKVVGEPRYSDGTTRVNRAGDYIYIPAGVPLRGGQSHRDTGCLPRGADWPERAGECGDAAGLGGQGTLALGARIIARCGIREPIKETPPRGPPAGGAVAKLP